MITVTLEKRNGVAIGVSENATMKIDRGMLARPPQPLTANTTSSKCRLWINLDKGGPVVEEWLVTETFATVTDNLTTDSAESGAEVTTNKVTSVSGASTDVQYPSAKLLYDQLALKAPLASPTLTGIPAAPTAAAGISTTQLATTAMVQARTKITPNGTAAGIDTYTAAIEIAGTPPLAITAAAGLLIVVKFTNANTGAATLNINSTAAVAITKKDGTTALAAADITAGSYQSLFHDGTSWVALGIA